jgi:hypothetical protein
VNTSFNDLVSSTKTDMNKKKIFQKKQKQNVNIQTMYIHKEDNKQKHFVLINNYLCLLT